MKVAVLGAGVSGLTVAHFLQSKNHEVTLFEECVRVGGLAKSKSINEMSYDMHGGHVFNTKNSIIKNWIFSLLSENNWSHSVRNAKIYLNNRFISYPFEFSMHELEENDAIRCISDFFETQKTDEPDNFYDWLVWSFGGSIANKYLIPYNEKIWKFSLKAMSTKWIKGKMPIPTRASFIRSILQHRSNETMMPHSTFYYPMDGIQNLSDAISRDLPIITSFKVERIQKKTNSWFINDKGPFDIVVSTIPLPKLPLIMDLPSSIVNSIRSLKYNSLNTLICKCPISEISWLYLPEKFFKPHRIVYQSAISKNNRKENNLCIVEVIGPKINAEEKLGNDYVMPMLGINDVLCYEFTEFAYVIYDLGYEKNINLIKAYFNAFDDFYLLGRFARWNYNNMDICMDEAYQLSNVIDDQIKKKSVALKSNHIL